MTGLELIDAFHFGIGYALTSACIIIGAGLGVAVVAAPVWLAYTLYNRFHP